MKFKGQLFILVLLVIMTGCSKPEPPVPVAKAPKKKSTAKKHIQSIPAVTSETNYTETESQAMATVRVLDADTELPVMHATVRVRWISDSGPIMCSGIHIEDGNYQVPTNGLKGVFYVGALADGYLPDDKENPKFPVELSMKEGETIEVSGTIHHANGDPVTNGIVNLEMTKFSFQAKQQLQLGSCSSVPDSRGNFVLPHVPATIDEMYATYVLQNNAEVEFKDQAFSTSTGDVHLSLCLPPQLIIKGRVLFSSGTAVSGAWVWTERVTGEEPDGWNTKLVDASEAVNGALVQSDAEGYFELSLLKVMECYVIKAFHPFYEMSYSGPYSDSTPPPEPVELLIKDEGSRLYGRLSDSEGKPVTNCEVKHVVFKKTAQHTNYGKSNKIRLDIAEDGSYISGIISPGPYELTYIPYRHYPQNKKVIVQKNKDELCDVSFIPYCVITGTVYDAETRQPIPDVVLVNKSWRVKESQEISKITDQNGKFWVLGDSNRLRIEFQHPEYAAIMYRFNNSVLNRASNEKTIHTLSPEIFLSKSGDIRVYGKESDGTPLDGHRVEIVIGRSDKIPRGNYARFRSNQRAEFINGEALLTNIYVMFSPVYVEVYSKYHSGELAKSDLIDIVAGEEVSVTVTTPPTGALALNFLHPIIDDSIKIEGKRIRKTAQGVLYNYGFNNYDFIREKQRVFLDGLHTNEYQVIIKDKMYLSIKTNVLITANNTTEVIINNNTNMMGVICGSVTTREGEIVDCFVSLLEQESGKQAAFARLSYKSSFSFGVVSRDSLYDLSVRFDTGSMTNITIKNIVPDGAPIDIQLPAAYRVTGNVVDENGKPLRATFNIRSSVNYGLGEFILYPIFPGTHSLTIKVQGYPKVERKVTVYDSNVDLGDIVIKP